MVLQRQPKKYKHLIRIMLTHLVEYENITTTRAKAKHLRSKAEKLLNFAKRAEAGQTSPLNLLKGRVHTKKAEQKLLLDLIPRIKHMRGSLVHISQLKYRRVGDNAPMVELSIKGNQKSEYEKRRREEAMAKGKIPNLKAFASRTLLEEKELYQKIIEEQPQKAQFFKQKLARVDFELWTLGKERKEPPKYTLLV